MRLDLSSPRWGACFAFLCAIFTLSIGIGACGLEDNGGAANAGYYPGNDPGYQPTIAVPDDREIKESDLVKFDGVRLYIQNPHTGLNVISVADPEHPSFEGRIDVTGEAGELYLLREHVLIVFEKTDPWIVEETEYGITVLANSRAVAVRLPRVSEEGTKPNLTQDLSPDIDELQEVARVGFTGRVVASRVVGNILYVITTNDRSRNPLSWVYSVDVSVPEEMSVIESKLIDGRAIEVFVNDRVIFITQPELDHESEPGTRIRYIDISNPGGILRERGEIVVTGVPQGRFHMDATSQTFLIVTYSEWMESTNLYVIDIRQPDNLEVLGFHTGLAPGEELWATRFEGNMAYIVTYLRRTAIPTDPLWTVSLANPREPELLGELEVPGWSNYIFPRGNRLVAVGRGDRGARVAVSLFDVSNPRYPQELRRLEFGQPEATSEANADFRGVTIIDKGPFAERPMIAVPFTNNIWKEDSCWASNYLQFIDLYPNSLWLKGKLSQQGHIRRTVPFDHRLYSISDRTLVTLDLTSRDKPNETSTLEVGDPSVIEECTWLEDAMDFDDGFRGDGGWWDDYYHGYQEAQHGFCTMSPGSDPLEGMFSWLFLVTCVIASIYLARRRYSPRRK